MCIYIYVLLQTIWSLFCWRSDCCCYHYYFKMNSYFSSISFEIIENWFPIWLFTTSTYNRNGLAYDAIHFAVISIIHKLASNVMIQRLHTSPKIGIQWNVLEIGGEWRHKMIVIGWLTSAMRARSKSAKLQNEAVCTFFCAAHT